MGYYKQTIDRANLLLRGLQDDDVYAAGQAVFTSRAALVGRCLAGSQMSRSTANRVVDYLLNLGFIELAGEKAGDLDARFKWLTITDRGRKHCTDARPEGTAEAGGSATARIEPTAT